MLKYGEVIPVSNMVSKTTNVRNIGNLSNNNSSTTIINNYSTSQSNFTNINVKTTNTSQPIINYNLNEKKYVQQITITGTQNVFFKNILNSIGEAITFTGKIISRDTNNNIASFIFSGYSKLNVVNYTVTTLHSDDLINWKIISMTLNDLDLILQVNSNQANWVISIDSISI
jgi:hypothetical protein